MSIRKRFQQRLKRALRPAVLSHGVFYLSLLIYYFAGFSSFILRPVSLLLSSHWLFIVCACILVGLLISFFRRLDHWTAICDLATGLSVFGNESSVEISQLLPTDSLLQFCIVMALPITLAASAMRAKRRDAA